MSQPEKNSPASVESSSVWAEATSREGTRDLTGKTLGDFHVERLLGRGGMGEVYLARQISLHRPVALKVLRPDLLSKPTYLSRFEAEATAVAKLNHPNIVHVYTLGVIDDIRFIAMEYVQGTNLRDYIRKKGALELPLALSIMKQAGVAVGTAGELGMIHRDIKPENLLLTRKGHLKVADFGLCRETESESLGLTQPGVAMGTPLYMSPEQAQGHPIDHRSDLYSLGVTFYHMLSGSPPFRAETPLAVAMKHVNDLPISLTVHRPDIPPDLDRLVLKLMAKAPADRYQSAGEMLRDLAKVRESMNTVSMAVPDADSTSSSAVRWTAAKEAQAATWRSRFSVFGGLGELRIGVGALATLMILGLAVGLAWGWFSRTEDLLSPGAPEPEGPPALWMAPAWTSVRRLSGPEEQYDDAQLRVSRDELAPAWLAVPGHFPGSREWAARAYTQLARLLLNEGDSHRLRMLADEIGRWKQAQTHEKELAGIIRVAAAAEEGDLDAVVRGFELEFVPESITDPALLELGIQVTGLAERDASELPQSGQILASLGGIRRRLMQKLFFADRREHDGRPPAPGRVPISWFRTG